jgi:hypothetical protein
MMKRRLLAGAFAAASSMVALATPVWAHGDHDARPLARHLEAGPYIISLWQVYPDAGEAMAPHLIVMFDGEAAGLPVPEVMVTANSTPMDLRPSITTSNGWETSDGIVEGDVVNVIISDGTQSWDLDPVIVPSAPTSMLPMQELIYASMFLTAGTACWVAARTARAWRRPAARASAVSG